MIGAKSSPLTMFSGGSSSGPSMYDIGYNGSAGGAVSNAIRSTIDRYHSELASQQEQSNKLAQIQATSGAELGKDKSLIDYKRQFAAQDPDAAGPFTQVDPATGKSFIRSTSVDPGTGMNKVSWAPVSINAPEDPVKTIESLALQPTIARMKAESTGQPNAIQQGAGASVPSAQGSGDKRQQAMQILKNAGKVINEQTINHVMKQI